jgi:predicted ATPase/class 3 adenylate cyclase
VGGLPTGTVTLLFSDMEGSTRLLSRLGERYVDALDAQRKILRTAWSDFAGTELGTEGDSFYVAFDTAHDAVAAVARAQRELDTFPWPDSAPVRVRMGLHTGAPIPHDGAYVGIDVHRAARISSVAHGGQIVLSSATAALVDRALPGGLGLRDLGEHRLKDLEGAEHLYQLDVEGLTHHFPPLRSLGASSSLPIAPAALLGRDADTTLLEGWIQAGHTRLLTLTGPGGSGKTSLAIALAHEVVDAFPDGVYFVPLQAAGDSGEIAPAIAEVLGLAADERNRDGVADYLRPRTALLILDNLEHLEDAAAVVEDLLAVTPSLAVLATSRRPLHVTAEQEYAVAPLRLPSLPGIDEARDSPAVQLFVRQARRVRPDFELTADNAADVAEVCRRLDGMPLAIELAAARAKVLSPHALVARLTKALDLAAVGRGRPERHQTLRSTIGWSYDLLTAEQQEFLAQLGVFVGGADLDAVRAVWLSDDRATDPLDLVLDLADASLLHVAETSGGEPRVGLLETVRSFAAERLAEIDDQDAVRDRHAGYFSERVDWATDKWHARDFVRATAMLHEEHENICAALAWMLGEIEPSDGVRSAAADLRVRGGLHLAQHVAEHWPNSGRLEDSSYWLGRAIERAGAIDSPDLAMCLTELATCLRFSGQREGVREYAEQGLAMMRRLGGPSDPFHLALRGRAVVEELFGELEVARTLLQESLDLARADADLPQLHRSLVSLGALVVSLDDLEGCRRMEEEALGITIQLGDYGAELGCRQNLACTFRLLGRLEEAEAMMRGVAAAAPAVHEGFEMASIADDYAAILAGLGQDVLAMRLWGSAQEFYDGGLMTRSPIQWDEIASAVESVRERVPVDMWDTEVRVGRATPLGAVLSAAAGAQEPASRSGRSSSV